MDQSHHETYWLVIDGKRRAIRTRLSHGERDANASKQHLIARQMGLSGPEFADFVECRMDGAAYAGLVVRRGMAKG